MMTRIGTPRIKEIYILAGQRSHLLFELRPRAKKKPITNPKAILINEIKRVFDKPSRTYGNESSANSGLKRYCHWISAIN